MDVSSYNSLYKDKFNVYYVYLIFISFVLLLAIFICSNISYKKYYLVKSVINEECYLNVLLNEDSLELLNSSKALFINNKNYKYFINSVEPIVNENNLLYQVTLDVNLDSKICVKNNVLNLKILIEKQSVLKYILKKVGGMYQ